MKKITLFLIALLLTGTLLMTACNPVTTSTATDTTNPTTSGNPTTTGTTSITTYPTKTGGGTFVLYGSNPYTLDPAVSYEANSSSFIVQIFNGLVRLDDNLEPAGDIAASWDVSGDGMTYTFHLRNDVVFQDGKKLTAADVKYSWERACNPATGSPVAGTYLGDIAGAKEMLAGQANNISGLKITDDYTLQVTIDAPKSYFLSKLTYPTAMIVDKNNVSRGGEWWREPNGTGPFKLKEWQDNDHLILERNNKYYGEKSGVENVEFTMLSGLPMSMYEMGQIDVVDIGAAYIDRVTDPAGEFYQELRVSPQLSFSYIGFNTNTPPFDDINVRRAFTLAIDKDKIIDLVLRNLLERADGVLPPGMPGYNANLNGMKYDAAAARAALKASRYGDASKLPKITFTTSGYGGVIPSTLDAIITQWRENLGVEVTVRQLDPSYYFYNLKAEKTEMFDMGWIADYPHPQDFLDVLFHTGAENNFAEYSNPAVDAVLDAAGVEPDMDKSLQMYQQAEQMLMDDAAIIPLWFGQNYELVKPYVKGYELSPMGFVWLSKVMLEGK